MTVVALKKLDPKAEILAKLGDLSEIQVASTQVLCAIYIRPERSKGGVILTAKTRDEDVWQGKVLLILRKGTLAYDDPSGKFFGGQTYDEGDWIIARSSSGVNLEVDGVPCRLLPDELTLGRVNDPTRIW